MRTTKARHKPEPRGAIKPYPVWTCDVCGRKHGRGMPKDHVCTIHYGKCDVCGKNNYVTEPRDYGHFPDWFRVHKTRRTGRPR